MANAFILWAVQVCPLPFSSRWISASPTSQKLLQAGEGYREIPIDHLPQYAGDRIFMLLSDKPESQMATMELINSAIWKGLPAVQNNHAYLVDATKWNYGDAFTREKLLGALPKLLVTAK